MREVVTLNAPELWLRCGRLYCLIGDAVSAEDAFNSVIEIGEGDVAYEAQLSLA